jgi:hypothetical protein
VREHLHTDTVHASALELSGERVHHAGGNDAMAVMRGWGSPQLAGPTPAAQLMSAVPTGTPGARLNGGAVVANSSGGQVSLGKVQVTTAVLFAGAVLALVLLHRVGFKFSATVG